MRAACIVPGAFTTRTASSLFPSSPLKFLLLHVHVSLDYWLYTTEVDLEKVQLLETGWVYLIGTAAYPCFDL